MVNAILKVCEFLFGIPFRIMYLIIFVGVGAIGGLGIFIIGFAVIGIGRILRIIPEAAFNPSLVLLILVSCVTSLIFGICILIVELRDDKEYEKKLNVIG